MLNSLLSRGYFPKELPSPFNTTSYAAALSDLSTLPAVFSHKMLKKPPPLISRPATYSLARNSMVRRQLSICSPVQYFQLSREIAENWVDILPKVSGTKLSATAPILSTGGRAITGAFSQADRPKLALKNRVGKKFTLTTDISRFYHSIYTHSIPWALHGKTEAKLNHGPKLLDNRIDFFIRNGQDRQTNGIPIGPDTSLVLAEILMQRCDEALIKKLPAVQGSRFIDDYELSFSSRTEAEEAFHVLSSCLADFELALNPKKTFVHELPMPLEPTWAMSLKRFAFRQTKSGQISDLEGYFNLVFELHAANPEESVMQYAIARLRTLKVGAENWESLQRLMLLCVVPEPATLPYVMQQVVERKNAGMEVIADELGYVLNSIIQAHASLQHSSEVANAVWSALALKINIDVVAAKSLSQCDDSVVALTALDCEKNGLVVGGLDHSKWIEHMTGEGLHGPHWLLSYEASVKNWLPSKNGDYIGADPAFSFLRDAGVAFYDVSKSSAGAKIPTPTLPSIPLSQAMSYF